MVFLNKCQKIKVDFLYCLLLQFCNKIYKKTIDKIKNIGYNNLIVKESSWRRDPFMFASIRSDEGPLHI